MENQKSLLKTLEDYFLKLDEKDILTKTNEDIYIDMSWLFTEVFDRKIIQKAISNIMKTNNINYESKTKYRNQKPEDIEKLKIINNNGKIVLQAIGVDDWTKLNISDENTQALGGIPIITEEALENEILNVINSQSIEEMLSDLDLDDDKRKELFTAFKEKKNEGSKATKIGIKEALSQIGENLVDYYEYLIKAREEHTIHKCSIMQRTDSRMVTHTDLKSENKPRLNYIIPFTERAKILENEKPIGRVDVEEQNEDGDIISNSYITYIYKDSLATIGQPQNGNVFISEPLCGDRNTRINYLTQEEFNKFQVEEGKDKISEIVKKYLSMSREEFDLEPGTARLSHTDMQTYKERIQFYLQGIKAKSLTNMKYYLNSLNQLYKKKDEDKITLPYYTSKDIADIAKDVPASNVDRTAQSETLEKEEPKRS